MKPHWRGLGKSHIYFLPKQKVWRLESFYATEKYADLTADDTDPFAYYPLGRLNWKIQDGICQMSDGAIRSLTLTTCFPNKFTCDDGSCVRINQRCNLVVDCPDKSDEKVKPEVHQKLKLSNNAMAGYLKNVFQKNEKYFVRTVRS